VREKRKHLGGKLDPENLGMQAMSYIFADAKRLEAAQRMARFGQWPFVHKDMISKLPGMLGGWTQARDLRPIPRQSFRQWWRKRERKPNA